VIVFGRHVLDALQRELRCNDAVVALEPQVFDLLEYLLRHRDRVVGKDELMASVWAGRIVSDATVAVRINAARRAVGDSGALQQLIRTFPRKGFRFVGDARDARPAAAAAAAVPVDSNDIRFCRTSDGVSIATAACGTGVPVVRTATWLNHLQAEWHNPIRAGLMQFLASRCRLVRYDSRGNGLSDRDAADISFDGFVRDLDAVVEAWGLSRCVLLGMSQGAPIAIEHAVRHPERVSRLVIHGGFSLGRNKRGSPDERKMGDAMATLLQQGWGQEDSVFMRMYSAAYLPEGTPEQIRSFAALQHSATSGEVAVRIRAACDDIDIRALLPEVKVPTLVLHSRLDHVQPFEEGRRIAAAIPGAKFVPLESSNHVPMPGEPAWDQFTSEVAAFLAA